jgi:putative transposase
MKERKLNRMRGYDYTEPGYYFVTICTYHRVERFGSIRNGQMILNEQGKIADACWRDLPNHYRHIRLDEFVIMPNHVHGIIIIMPVGNRHACSLRGRGPQCNGRQYETLPIVIGSFKSAVKRLIRQAGFRYFHWQKSFHDHIIRNEMSLNKIRQYIIDNPSQWDADENNPLV